MNRQSNAFSLMIDDPIDATPVAAPLGFNELYRFFRRRWLLICLIATLTVILAAMLLSSVTPRYTATAELTLIDQRQQTTPITDLLSGVPLSRQLVEQEITTMNSKAFMINVVKTLGIDESSPIINSDAAPSLPSRVISRIKGFVGSILAPSLPEPAVENEEQTAEDDTVVGAEEMTPSQAEAFRGLAEDIRLYGPAADKLASSLNIAQRGNGYVIEVSSTSDDPNTAAQIANVTATEYARFSLDIRGQSIEDQVQLLSARVEDLGRDLARAENSVVDFQEQSVGADNDSVNLLNQQLQDLFRRLVEVRSEILRAEARHDLIEEIIQESGALKASEFQNSPILIQLRSQLSSRRIELSRASEQFGPNSGQVSAILANSERIEEEIEIETQRIVAELATEAEVGHATARLIEREIDALEETVISRSRSMVELGNLRRIADANRIAYEQFLNLATESAQYRALQQPTIRVLSYAEVPESPSSPRSLMTIAVAGLAGLIIGVSVAILLEILNNRIQTVGQLRRVSGLPVIGSFSRIRAFNPFARHKKSDVYHAAGGRHLLSEARKTALFLTSSLDRDSGTILVTSAVEGEGRTAVSIAIATALALDGESVLLVKSGSDEATFGSGGTSDGEPTAFSMPITSKTGYDYLQFPDQLNSSEGGHLRRKINEFLEDLSSTYNYIIIAAPPVLSSGGGLGFVKESDAVVLATKWNATAEQTVESGVQRLRDLGTKNMYMVLTMVNRRKEAQYEYRGFKNTQVART